MSLKDLQEQREKLLAEARERLDNINKNTDESREAELESQHDTAMAELDKLDAKIDRELKLADAEKRAEEIEERSRVARRPVTPTESQPDTSSGIMSYRQAFHAFLRSSVPGAAPLSAEARGVLNAGYSDIPAEERAQTSGTNSAGGFTVPTELQNIMIKSMLAWGPMYSEDVGTVISTTGGGSITMPTVNDTAVTAGAHTEGATLTDDGGKDVTFGQKQLDAFAFDTEWLRVSKELADDSIFAMETLLGELLGERLGRIANLQLTTGSGSSAPNGVVTASSLGVTASATAAITGDEIINFVHSVDPAYRTAPKVQFMFNDSTLSAIRKLKDGDGNYLWQMGNVQQGVPGSLLGYPYRVNQAMAGLGAAAKVMLFGDFGKYYVRKVGAPLIGAIQDKDFWPGFGAAGYIRFDGELGDTAAVKHLITAAS